MLVGAAGKPSFRAAFARRRCIVPASGFYELQREGAVRQPWLIAPRDGRPMALAGLWEHWSVPEGAKLRGSLDDWRPGDVVETFTILTTRANGAMQEAAAPVFSIMACLPRRQAMVGITPSRTVPSLPCIQASCAAALEARRRSP